MTNQEFITKVAAYVKKYAPDYGIKVYSPIIAQAICESAWGKSKLSAQYHNYFGLKCGTKWTGKSVNMKTQEEYTVGVHTTISDNFRVYDSMEEGIKGYFEFIQLARYQNLRGITDPQKYLETIKADGYATSSTYVQTNMNIIKAHDLTKYDTASSTTKVNEAKLVMDKALEYLGVKESPMNSNNVIFNTHYYGGAVSGSWYPWCCAYVWDIFRMAGLSHLFYGGQKTAYCPTVLNWAKNNGLVVDKTSAQYGDIILFDWGGKDGVADHIGFVESYKNGVWYTVEGNTGYGNDSNGGQVMRRERYAGDIIAIVRPKYASTVVAKIDTWKATGTATATVNNLYVRETPNGKVLGELMKGNRVEVNGETSGMWSKVKVAGIGVAWIATKYLQKDGATNTNTVIKNKQDQTEVLFVGKVTASELNVRTWAGTGNPQIKSYPILKMNNEVEVMNFTQKDSSGNKWYYVRIAGKYYGFVSAQYIVKK